MNFKMQVILVLFFNRFLCKLGQTLCEFCIQIDGHVQNCKSNQSLDIISGFSSLLTLGHCQSHLYCSL